MINKPLILSDASRETLEAKTQAAFSAAGMISSSKHADAAATKAIKEMLDAMLKAALEPMINKAIDDVMPRLSGFKGGGPVTELLKTDP